MTRTEFINSIRSKYPQYNNIDDNTLFNKIIEKYPVYKNKITDTQTSQQQTPVTPTVTPQKEEPGLLEGVKTFLFGDEDKKPKAELISEEFVETKPEKPFVFSKPTPISLLDKEYNQKIKAVEDKYNALQENPNNYSAYIPSRFAIFGADPLVKTYKVDYTGQKEAEKLNLNVERFRKQGRNLTPEEQEQETITYTDNINKNKTIIENKAKEKKSYLEELSKEDKTDSPNFISSWKKVINTVRNTWDYNSKVDDDIAKAETGKNNNQKFLDFVGKGVNPFKNREYNNGEDMIDAGSYIDPSIASDAKKAIETQEEITTKIVPTAEIKEDEQSRRLRRNFPLNSFITIKEFKGLTAEQFKRNALEKAYNLAAQNLDNELTPLYDKIQSEIGIPKSEVARKIDTYLTFQNEREQGLYPNIGKLSENDIKIFNNPNFKNIADTYRKTAIPQIVEGKKRVLSLANVGIYNQEKANAFGTINQVENIGRKEAIRTAILDKNVEEQGILSEDGYNKLLYNTAWFSSKFNDFTINQTAAAAQIGTQAVTGAFTGKAYTPEWTENIINTTDLFDNLTQQDSHFKLSIFKDDKYIDRTLPSGDIVKVQYTPEGDIINAFGGDMEYTINNPEIMQWLANDFEANKEEIVANGKSLWETEGGKAVFLENVWNSMAPEMVEEMPSLLVGATAGRIAGALIKGAANERRLAQGAEYMIIVASNMTEQYPSIYKKYQEAAQDKDNPFPALATSGALAFATLFTSTLQSKAIGLTGNDINKVIMPEAIEASSEAVKIINKQFAKIPDVTLREKLTNAAINKVMFKNIMSSAAKVLKTSAKVGGQEATEEVILEPLVNVAANFINEKITGDRAYNQETLKDLNFLNPDVAITSFFTGSTLSQGMDIVKSMSNKGPFSKEDYLKTAFENEATFTSMVDIMTQSSTNNFSEENQAKMMADYKALKDSYNARKSELGVNDEALATLNFANPVIKGFVKSIGETEQSLNKVNSGRTFDNAIIRQSLNERELAEKKIALDEEAAKGNVSVSPEGTYRTVGSNPLTEELGKQISEYEQLQLSNNNLTTFIDTFNKETKPVQKQYIQELNQVTSEAPDLIYAKNSKEGNYAYKAVSNAIMDKQMAMSQLEKTNAEIETAVIDGTDTKELQVQKQNLEKAIKASDKTITTLKKQYKAGRVNTQNETIDRFNEFRTASLVLQEKLQSMAGVDATDEEIEQSEINDAYADYLDAFKALKKSNSTLKKEYGVEVLDSKYTPISLEEFQAKKNNIKEKNTLSKKLSENKGTLGDVERLIGLEYATGAKRTKDRMQVTTPKDKEEIKAILDDKEQVYEYAKRLGFNKKKSYAQTKKAVRTYLNKQLSTQDETRLEGVSAVFVEKTPRQVNGNPMFEVEGALYKPAGYSVSPTMMTQEERNTVLTNAVISEIAKQVFNNSLLLTPYNVSQIINKVIIESGFDTEVGIDNRSLQFIAETILALKADLDAKGFSYKFNDDVVISKLSDDTERGYEGVATTPILTVVDTEGNVHLIDFKSFSAGKYEAASSGWSNTLTEIQAIFQDNGITVASINVLPIRVNNTSTTENGLTNLSIGKTSFNTIPNNDNPISRTLLQLTTSEPILTTLEEEGLLTKEEVESFNDIPLDEADAPITPADKLKEDSLVVLAPEIVVTTEGAVSGQATVTATEKDMKAEDKNKHTKDTPKEVMEEETPEGVFAGLGKGVYIQVKETSGGFYMITIFGDTDLANTYGKKRMSLEDLKLVYKANNWFTPKTFEGTGVYQLRYADTLTPVLSKNYVEFVQPNGFNEVINDITVAADLIGTEVEIVENNEPGYNGTTEGYNDTNEVQKDFKNKASLSIVNENGEKIAVVPPNSPLRENLKITNKNGLNRLQPTIATIKDIKFNNFNRKPDELFSEWEKKALASGVLVPGEYEMVYIGMERGMPVFKNKNGVVVPGRVPKKPELGSAYLFITNFPTKNIMIPMGTPKLAELGYTIQDLKPLFALIDINEITKNEANAESIYSNFIAQLDALVREGKLKDPKLKDLQFLLSSELGGQELTLRATSTQLNIDKLDTIYAYNDKEKKEGILINFLLDRIITMNDGTLGSHSIGVNPEILFADNALVLDNIKSKPKAKKQILSSTASQPRNTTIISELLSRLKETGLANEVFEMTNDEIEEKLVELGVDAETAKQVVASMMEKNINVDGVITKVKPIDVDVVNGFYSPLEKIISESKQDKMPVKQWIDKFAKGEEAKWTGLTDWLSQQEGSVSKKDILNYLKDNRINILEVVGSEKERNLPKSPMRSTITSLQLEGEKGNYKEVLVTLPISSKNSRGWQDYRDEMVQKGLSPKEADETRRFLLGSPIENIDMASVELSRKKMGQKFFDDYQDVLSDKENRSVKENQFQSSHFSESNILVHLRMNTRTDAEGNKVLFLEEVQSDWGQKGKKEGFRPTFEIRNEKGNFNIYSSVSNMKEPAFTFDTKEDANKMLETLNKANESKPLTTPFVTDTNAWTKLGLKVALKEAVSQGVDKIAWTTGEQQNERYDLSNTLESIDITYVNNDEKMVYILAKNNSDGGYRIDANGKILESGKNELTGNIDGKNLEEVIGKDLTNKVLKAKDGEKLSGDGLKIGGKGMKGFYGSPTEGSLGIVGNVAKTLFKQEPKVIELQTTSTGIASQDKVLRLRDWVQKNKNEDYSYNDAQKDIESNSKLYQEYQKNIPTQYSIDITPELKAEVEEGLPLFQKQLSDNNITPTTAGFVYDGDVYLNIDNMNLDTPIHEFGHLWLSWAKNNLAEAYARGLELAKSDEAEPYRQYVMETQPNLKVDSEAFLDEVLAQAIGDNGARLVEENSAKTKSWLQGLWDAIGKMLGISELVANGGYKTLTLNDYAKAVAVDLLKGEKFTGKDGKTGETPDIRFQIVSLPNKDVKKLEKLANFETESVIIESNGAKAELYNEQLLDGDNSIYISEISSDVKGQGKATELLRKLQSFADNNGTILSLRASVENNIQTEGGLNQEQLVNWYNKNGFSIEEGYNNFDSDPKAPFMLYFPKNKIEVSTEETTQIPDCV